MSNRMPLYEYKCAQCDFILQVRQDSYESTEQWCLVCDGYLMDKQITSTAVRFQGSGFYETDYKGK